MKIALLIITFLSAWTAKSQSCYSGYLGDFPITLVMYHYSDGESKAYYAYDKYDNPIKIDGTLKNSTLRLLERNKSNEIKATLIFKNFKENDEEIKGTWSNSNKTKTLPISLTKNFDIQSGKNNECTYHELLQSESTKEHYFKTIISKNSDYSNCRVTGIKVFEKMTDKLIQTIKLDCQLFGIDNVNVGDYNFDGLTDFSVFEASYSGPNTSRIYILRKSNAEEYVKSDFSGTSLEFDKESKRIYEHNQCCAGRSKMKATYKVVDNKMVLIKRQCLEYDHEKEDFIEVECY